MLVSDNFVDQCSVDWITRVLILVLVDVGLGRSIVIHGVGSLLVLILVLVDVGLGPSGDDIASASTTAGLNPCFSGCWSRTANTLCSCLSV